MEDPGAARVGRPLNVCCDYVRGIDGARADLPWSLRATDKRGFQSSSDNEGKQDAHAKTNTERIDNVIFEGASDLSETLEPRSRAIRSDRIIGCR
jgi:hypothetical protein